MATDQVVRYPGQVLPVHGGLSDVDALHWVELFIEHRTQNMECFQSAQRDSGRVLQRRVPRTSLFHTPNVSMSLDAHIPGRPAWSWSQPACAILQPQLATWMPASSSSASFAFEVHTSPSEDADSSVVPLFSAEDAAGR